MLKLLALQTDLRSSCLVAGFRSCWRDGLAMFEKATAAFRRVLVQDHDNIEALLATAKVVHNFLAMRLTQALRLTIG